MSWNDFFSSQLFGVIIGALMTGGFTWLLDCLRYKRERKAHIQQKREELYIQAIDLLMIYDVYTQNDKSEYFLEIAKRINELQAKIGIYASKEVSKRYYSIANHIRERQDRKHIQKQINNLKAELGKFLDEIHLLT